MPSLEPPQIPWILNLNQIQNLSRSNVLFGAVKCNFLVENPKRFGHQLTHEKYDKCECISNIWIAFSLLKPDFKKKNFLNRKFMVKTCNGFNQH